MEGYQIVYSKRRTLCIEVRLDGTVIIRAPRRVSKKEIEKFIADRKEWIERAVSRQAARSESPYRKQLTDAEIAALKEQARIQLPPRVKYFSEIMGLFPSAVKISSAATRFGSCSSKNSINFSYRLMLYPQEAIDYVIVHELAHIKHKNHSKDFYALVGRYMPDYKKREALLKK